ncbi:Mobile element protein (plasmid) [Rhodococcus sp. WAY2]|nr:Mobile element protein [Rhodococcus sp. WAY2]
MHRPVEPAQYTALRFGETLFLQGLLPSIGSVADAFDNALAETTVGLYKNPRELHQTGENLLVA